MFFVSKIQIVVMNLLPEIVIKKILLIEAEQSGVDNFSALLTSNHCTVNIATDGQTGLKLSTSNKYDLIVLGFLPVELGSIKLCLELCTQGYQRTILLLATKNTIFEDNR